MSEKKTESKSTAKTGKTQTKKSTTSKSTSKAAGKSIKKNVKSPAINASVKIPNPLNSKKPIVVRKKIKITLPLILTVLAIIVLFIVALYFVRPDVFYEMRSEAKDWMKEQSELILDEKTVNQGTQQTNGDVKSSSGKGSPLGDENYACYFGNPSSANKSDARNYLMEKQQYILSYNSEKYIPNWVMWHLSISDCGSADRSDDFRPDDELPDDWYGIKKADYQYTTYGFDRGHVCPSADRTKSKEDNSMTFLMTNMLPQSPNCNRAVWKELEAYERSLAQKGNELYIAAGPYGTGGTSDKGTFNSIQLKNNLGAIEVPEYCWKIIMILEEGDNDFSRVKDDTVVIAAFIPNNQECNKNGSWEQYLTSVDFIEEKTGYDFFSILEDSLEDVLESRIYKAK